MFRDVIARLADVVHVVAPDLPGFGASDLPPEPTFEALARSIDEVLGRLEVERRILYLHDELWDRGLAGHVADPGVRGIGPGRHA